MNTVISQSNGMLSSQKGGKIAERALFWSNLKASSRYIKTLINSRIKGITESLWTLLYYEGGRFFLFFDLEFLNEFKVFSGFNSEIYAYDGLPAQAEF